MIAFYYGPKAISNNANEIELENADSDWLNQDFESCRK